MGSDSLYIKQLLNTDIFDSEKLLELRNSYFQTDTEIQTVTPHVDREDIEPEVNELSSEFWGLSYSIFRQRAFVLLQQCEKFADLKQHLLILANYTNIRETFTKLEADSTLNQVFIKCFKELIILRGRQRIAFELKTYEEIKESTHHATVAATIKYLQRNEPDITAFYDQWLQKILGIRKNILNEKKAEKSGM